MALKTLIKKWVFRYIKYNIIGLTVFAIGTLFFWTLFPFFGMWSWIVANAIGGIVDFSLISYFNRTKKGHMFEGCKETN
jgi:hypothetical protein